MKPFFKALGAVLVLCLLAAAGLYFATRAPAPVAATVTDRSDLPSETVLGHKLHLQVTGSDTAPLVIVLHGGPGGDYRSLLPLEALTDTHRVLFYDQRGAGLSERVADSALTLTGHLEELAAIADTHSPEAPVTLIGHSWGAMLASAYMGAWPARVDRAVLIEPGFLTAAEMAAWQERASLFMSGPAFWRDALWYGFEMAHVDGPDKDAPQDHLLGNMVHSFAAHPDNPYHCPQTGWTAPAWRFGARSSQTMQASVTDDDFAAMTKGLTYGGPVLLLTGQCDTWIGTPLQSTRAYPGATLVEIANAGHDVVHDQPQAALSAIRRFLVTPLR